MNIVIDVPDGRRGKWSVMTFAVSKNAEIFSRLRVAIDSRNRSVNAGEYKALCYGRKLIMSNTRAEIADHLEFIYEAMYRGGHILINGLGLGMCVKAILTSDKVEHVTVIEKSRDVIRLVGPTYTKDPRVEIIHADAFEYKPPKCITYAVVWHDIWSMIHRDNLREMKVLHGKYARRSIWQGSWSRELLR